MEKVRMILVNAEEVILNEIKIKELNQEDIAKTYALIIKQGQEVDWGKINAAIVDRWSYRGLVSIKNSAWSNVRN